MHGCCQGKLAREGVLLLGKSLNGMGSFTTHGISCRGNCDRIIRPKRSGVSVGRRLAGIASTDIVPNGGLPVLRIGVRSARGGRNLHPQLTHQFRDSANFRYASRCSRSNDGASMFRPTLLPSRWNWSSNWVGVCMPLLMLRTPTSGVNGYHRLRSCGWCFLRNRLWDDTK
eukprot:RCo015909